MVQHKRIKGTLVAWLMLGVLVTLLFVSQSSADSGLTIHDTIRIGLYYGQLGLPSVKVSSAGAVQFFAEDMMNQEIALLSEDASGWQVQSEAIRLEAGPYPTLSGAQQILQRWPVTLSPSYIVQEPDGFYVVGGHFLSVEQARISMPDLTAAGLAGTRIRGAQHLVTVAPMAQEEAFMLRDELFSAGIRGSVFFNGQWRLAAGTETDLHGIDILRQALDPLTPTVTWQTQMPTFKRIEVLRQDGRRLLVYEGLPDMPLRVKSISEGTIMSVMDRQHRGIYEFMLDADNRFVVVSIMDVEDYLRGVVPREMPALWHLEAVKAQAVVARTYTQANRGKHAYHGFDLCTFSTCCQAYGGVDWEQENSNRAIDETRGEILFFNGRPALSFYHSDSGGHTESNHNVWNGNPIPYLGGVLDPYGALAGSTHSNWSTTFNQAELQRILVHNDKDVGVIVRVEVFERTPGGRALTVLVHGTRGFAELVNQQPRLPNDTVGLFALRSTMYDVWNIVEEDLYVSNGTTTKTLNTWQNVAVMTPEGIKPLPVAKAYVLQGESSAISVNAIPVSFTFDGSGWGHGVGLSQWGARGMAEQGHSYAQILLHYYQGIHIVDVLP